MTIEEILATADAENHPALQAYADRGLGIAVYENQDLGSRDVGRKVYLSFGGPTSTFKDPPTRAPDHHAWGLGWRYLLVGTLPPARKEAEHAS